jgi:hypothetical protein
MPTKLIRIVLLLAFTGLAVLGFAETVQATPTPPPAPVFHGSTCEHKSTGSVDIPAAHGSRYTLDGTRVTAGTYVLRLGAHAVTGRHGNQTRTWQFTVTYQNSPACILINPPPHLPIP